MYLSQKAHVCLMLVLINLLAAYCVSINTYRNHVLCNIGDRIDNGCYSYESGRSLLDCAVKCKSKQNCTEFVFSAQRAACYFQAPCAFQPTCSLFESDLKFYVGGNKNVQLEEVTQGPCANGGVFDGVGSCICSTTGGMVGDSCQTLPRSCSELQSSGYTDGEFPVTLDLLGDGSQLVQCVCILRDGTAEIDLIRSSGDFNTSYTFATYQNGYYLGSNDFFIGLQYMSTIMTVSSDVTATVHYNHPGFLGRAWVTYPNTEFLAAEHNYLFRQYSFEWKQGSSFEPPETSASGLIPNDQVIDTFIGSIFSTPDADRDGYSFANCAQNSERGWWHAFGIFCLSVNPLGLNYKALSEPPTAKHVTIPGVATAYLQDGFHYFSLSYKQS